MPTYQSWKRVQRARSPGLAPEIKIAENYNPNRNNFLETRPGYDQMRIGYLKRISYAKYRT